VRYTRALAIARLDCKFARLLYKNPPCIILDEPTAALDPIAEDKMYRSYNEIAARATSIFISHRLASTNFCDRIFLLDNAGFAEVGTHEELMAAGGKYKELFEIQSKYYSEH
jgi:ABC-type bacteriocin/lantibiotic exporters, contain an N-terminal double-glycine peptidase domain